MPRFFAPLLNGVHRLLLVVCLLLITSFQVKAAEVFIYSSQSSIRGLDLTQGTDRLLTTSPFSSGVNALAYNIQAGIVYYGDDTRVYRWDPSMGSDASAHNLMNDFSTGSLTAPITNINSTAGTYLDGKYYVGSESSTGYIQDIYELTMSVDGTQVVSVQPLNILDACGCTEVQLGGFGDVAALLEGGTVYLYGSSADLSGQNLGTSAGRWKFSPDNATFELLSTGSGGQMSVGASGTLYSNVGNSVREVNTSTGAISSISLITTSAPIYDFTGGFALDYGDAPDSYGAAFHRLSQSSGVRIGALEPDNEPGSLNLVGGLLNGSGDDINGLDDEDAISDTLAVSALVSEFSLTVECSSGSRVAGWLDSNINGVFDSSERNFNHPVTCAGGQAELSWSGLLAATPGDTFMRLRASTNAAAVSEPTGVASDGEVEDHPVSIEGSTVTSLGSCPADATSLVYDATDLPKSIGPNANTTTNSTISVSDTGTLVDVNVLSLSGTHTYINDLYFDLKHAGTTQRLYGPSCRGQNNFSFGFDDSASGTPPCAPTDGNTYPPVGSLSNFNGQDASGSWELEITDRFNGDSGSLDSWQLELCIAGGAVELPELVLVKHAEVVDQQVTLQFGLRNSGNVPLFDVSIVDDLDVVFGVGNYSISTVPTITSGLSGVSANSAFNGSSDPQLLASSVSLGVGEQLSVDVVIQINVVSGGANPGLYSNQAIGSATSPSNVSVSDLSGAGVDVSNDTDAPTSIQIDASAMLSGYVFYDTSSDSANAHNGVMDSAEVGELGRVVSIVNSASETVASVTTDPAGFWQVSIAPEHLDQPLQLVVQETTSSVFISEAPGFATGSITDGSLQVNATFAQNVININFGLISKPKLLVSNSVSATPGETVQNAHVFTASTHGVVSYSSTHEPLPGDSAWAATLWRDYNCNELLDGQDSEVVASFAVAKDEQQCLLSVHTIPANTIDGATATTTISAQFLVADVSMTGHGVEFDDVNLNLTTVVRVGTGRLELEKSVSNISTNGAAVASNTALPGQILEYQIVYRNAGDGPLSELQLNDSAPPFTTLQAGTAICATTPASVTCTPAINVDAVSWSFTGTLASGENGLVSYRIMVD